MTARPPTALLWFGVIGGALAWAVQFVANLQFTFAQCNNPDDRWKLPLHAWEIALSAAGVAVGIGAMTVSARIFRATLIGDVDAQERRGDGSPPPLGRIHFLAIVGLLVNFLALTIMVMTAIGAPLLNVCQQA